MNINDSVGTTTTTIPPPIDPTRATAVIDRSFARFDTAREGDPSLADGFIAEGDLQAVVANTDGRYSPDEVDAAAFLLSSTAARSFLDVGSGYGEVDGTIGRGDVDAAQLTIDSGGLDQGLLDTAAGAGSADGYVGGIDLQAAQHDAGIPDSLKHALTTLPPDLPLQTQLRAVFALRATQNDMSASIQLPGLIASPAFKGLDEGQQAQALALFGSNNATSRAARQDLLDFSAAGVTPVIDSNDTASLQRYLLSIATPVDTFRNDYRDAGVADDRRRPYTISEPGKTSAEFPSGDLPNANLVLFADVHYVDIEGKRIEVLMPQADQFDPKGNAYPDIDQIAKALAAQPAVSLENVDRVVVNPYTPLEIDEDTGDVVPSDAIASFFDGNSIAFNPLSTARTQAAMDFTMAHEVGHAVQQPQRVLGAPVVWSMAVQGDRLFPTDYSNDNYVPGAGRPYDPAEDFAETYMIYQMVQGTPDEAQMRALMPARFEVMDRMFGQA